VILRVNSIDKVVICEVSTNYVIESIVRELHDRDYMATVVAYVCNASCEKSHDASLKSLERIAKISSVDEFLY
jgi:nicotinamidase-related amidase